MWTGGPGDGTYILYLRCVDPAGNADHTFIEGTNMHRWTYVSPPPLGLILGCVFAFLGLVIILYWEYRRRQRKAAMERYALKRMRRRFKQKQKQAKEKVDIDFEELYGARATSPQGAQSPKPGDKARKKSEKRNLGSSYGKDAEKRELSPKRRHSSKPKRLPREGAGSRSPKNRKERREAHKEKSKMKKK